ncbi:hypothetical protein C8A05DRAFT_12801 [Staphylotrichum tortipilum]|uniref:DUF2293 domain-containing protein n=1 Tax=Staphylotrichum tortipilum TaxID=2831512 RepID=A0AAN6MTD1_9PEZI|nr:hypothetical protein C8A05DRAFT_12801 [Staphylotrichum longicolle]
MGREKKNGPGAGTGDHAKERHKRDRRGNFMDWSAPLPPGLVAKPERPRINSGHQSWFEFVENKDKKKKLEFEFTEKKEPPPGFEFVPTGNPALTTACKELSRETGAMIFIVTSTSNGVSKRLSAHLNRVGHHIRQTIVEQARTTLGDDHQLGLAGIPAGGPEPIPEKQEDINKQADAAIRDLFPRIPNTDRQMIIEHSFNKSKPVGKDGPLVGLASDISLSRRVQLAVLAHIRHSHTRYDQLLRETTYVNARKTVESLCLDILVKWRGDEETGRDQLDEILCEVIVISDSESDESDDEDDEGDSSATTSADEGQADRMVREGEAATAAAPRVGLPPAQLAANRTRIDGLPRANQAPQRIKKPSHKDRKDAKWAQRGFRRYQAARDHWQQAVERQRHENDGPPDDGGPEAMDLSANHKPERWTIADTSRPGLEPVMARGLAEPAYHDLRSYGTPVLGADVSRERGGRVSEVQHAAPVVVTYQVPGPVRAQEYPPINRFRPLVAAQPVRFGTPEGLRVSDHGQDLKDYLVQSIEPASPEPSAFPPRYPVSHHEPEPGPFIRGGEPPAQRLYPTHTEEGFIRLPPRPGPARLPAAADRLQDGFILLNPPHSSASEVVISTTAAPGPGLRRPATWHHSAAPDGRGPVSRPEARPVWIGQDGSVLSSEARPIVIQDYPSQLRQPRAAHHASLENRRPSPAGWSDNRQVAPVWVDERDEWRVDHQIEGRIETLQEDFVKIVRVSNKFPRQHEPRPVAPAGATRYSLRAAPAQQDAPIPPTENGAAYDLRRLAVQGQRLERVVGRVEVPPFPGENGQFVSRPHDGYRQERVVGVEYVQPCPSLEPRDYSARAPPYEVREPDFRSRSNSAAPAHVPYPPGPAYQQHVSRAPPARGEVILLD